MTPQFFGIRIIALLMFLISTADAQTMVQTIRGSVAEKGTQMPIPGAAVILEGSSPLIGTTTDLDGKFKLTGVPVGRPSIRISMVGYDAIKLSNIVLSSSKEIVLSIEMEPQIIVGNEVEIIAKLDKDKPLNELSVVSSRTFSVDEAQRYAGSFGDPARLVTSFAGVVAGNDQRNDIVVRGNSPLGILWRLEGIDIPSPNHFSGSGTSGGAVSALNTNLLANSDFSSGAFAAEYGNATSGAFDVRMRKGNNEKHEFTGQISFNGFEFGAEGPLGKKGKASYMASYRYSTLGAFDAVGIEFVKGGVPKYQDLNFKFNFPHKKGNTAIFGILGTSDIFFPGESDSLIWVDSPDDQQDLRNGSDIGVVGLNHLRFLNTNNSLKITIAGTGNKFRTQVDSISPNYNRIEDFKSSITENKLLFNAVLNSKLNQRFFLRSGIIASRMFYENDVSLFNSTLGKTESLINFSGNGDLLQAFSQLQIKASEKWTFNIGAHGVYFSINDKLSIEPRASVKFQATSNQSISLGYGRHSRVLPINIYLRETANADGSISKTNEDLEFLMADHLVLGYDWLINENLRLKSEVYYQGLSSIGVQSGRASSLSIVNFGSDFGDVIGPDSLVGTGTGRNVGIELTLEKFFSKNYYFLLTGSIYDSKYKGSDGIERNTAFNNRYALNLLAGKEIPVGKEKQNAIILSFRTVATGGMWTSPINLDASILAGTEIRDDINANTQQLKDYLRTDIRIGFRRNKKRFSEEYGFDIQNIFNRQNVFSERFNPLTGNVTSNNQVGFFPMALYRITF
jgi:hypothetical protein